LKSIEGGLIDVSNYLLAWELLEARLKMKMTIVLNNDAGAGRDARSMKIHAHLADSDQWQLGGGWNALGRKSCEDQ
jgi:hypothetical protein